MPLFVLIIYSNLCVLQFRYTNLIFPSWITECDSIEFYISIETVIGYDDASTGRQGRLQAHVLYEAKETGTKYEHDFNNIFL